MLKSRWKHWFSPDHEVAINLFSIQMGDQLPTVGTASDQTPSFTYLFTKLSSDVAQGQRYGAPRKNQTQ